MTFSDTPQLWSTDGLRLIASRVGFPIPSQRLPLNPSSLGTARIRVVVNLQKPRPPAVVVRDREKNSVRIRVARERLPPLCPQCSCYGHSAHRCPYPCIFDLAPENSAPPLIPNQQKPVILLPFDLFTSATDDHSASHPIDFPPLPPVQTCISPSSAHSESESPSSSSPKKQLTLIRPSRNKSSKKSSPFDKLDPAIVTVISPPSPTKPSTSCIVLSLRPFSSPRLLQRLLLQLHRKHRYRFPVQVKRPSIKPSN